MESVAGLNLHDLYFRKPVRQHVYEFAVILGLICVLYAAVLTWKYSSFPDAAIGTSVGLGIVAIGKLFPRALLVPWRLWMRLAQAMGFVMTLLILTICWCLLVIPISLILKTFGIKVMQTSYGENVPSYWMSRKSKPEDFKLLERQF